MQKVWYRTSKNAWFATILEGGRQKQIRLVNAPNDKNGRRLAEDQLVKELAARDYSAAKEADAEPVPSWATVAHVLNAFLKHSRSQHSEETAKWHAYLLNPFLMMFGKLRVTRLRTKHVRAWVKSKGYNPTSANKAIGVLKRAFNWAVEEEHLPRNPIAHVRKPKPLTRDRVLAPEERRLILASIKGPAFRQFVNAMTLTGCRPGEVATVTAADVDLGTGLWVLTKHKTAKKTGRPRIVYLCPEALELTRELVARHPEGPLFRNSRGKPWTRNAVRIRFRNLRKKHPTLKGVIAYAYRHSFTTNALENGVGVAQVAELLGHTDTQMVMRHYSHLNQRVTHMREQAARATRPEGGAAPGGTPE
jgi:integrase